MRKILIIIGTRPEAIKLLPLCIVLKQVGFKVLVLNTGQHRELLNPLWQIFKLKPDFNLDVIKDNQSLSDLSAELLRKIEKIVKKTSPDYIITQGDTTSCLIGSLVGFYNKVKIVHVEAGLRTYDMSSPFPEELNRRVVSLMADINFTPTEQSFQNLLNEKVRGEIIKTGNTGIDALIMTLKEVRKKESTYLKKFEAVLKRQNILITGHRRENHGERFDEIFVAIKELALENPQLSFIYPVHFNPNVRKQVNENLKGVENINLIEPVNYDEMIFLMTQSYIIMSDSGGIQEEAPSLCKPVIILRDTTERPEGVQAGCSVLAGYKKVLIKEVFYSIYNDENKYNYMANIKNPYGDGKTCNRIAKYLLNHNV